MGKITILDQHTIDKIAAGEVIERPASIVKELVENSIDAGATAVTVEIKAGGISFIRITDNGSGIAKEEVPIAFLRHATSKIRTFEDLIKVHSLGFRGEALSSIAAVCQVELITKTAAGLTGVRYIICGGKEKSMEDIGAPEGTTFLVRNLFYNTPARKKFLKSPVTEAGYINDLLERLSLSHPDISFKFISNNQTKLHTSGNTNLKDIIYGVYGRDIANQLVEINETQNEITLKGFIGKPSVSRGNRNYENYYINGRYIKSKLISKAIEDAYKAFMMQHKYPFTAFHISIPGELLDVNVHPAKMELRFRNPGELYDLILNTMKAALAGCELIPAIPLDNKPENRRNPSEFGKNIPEPFEKNRLEKEAGVRPNPFTADSKLNNEKPIPSFEEDLGVSITKNGNTFSKPNFAAFKDKPTQGNATIHNTDNVQTSSYHADGTNITNDVTIVNPLSNNTHSGSNTSQPETIAESAAYIAKQMELFDEKLLSADSQAEHRIVGQLFDTYWIIQFKDKMYMMDQHAAHEKVMYERTIKSLKNKDFTSQYISPPIILTLTMQEETLLKKHRKNFTNLGFVIEPFGGKEYSVSAVPGNLFGIAQKDLLIEMIDSLSDHMGSENPDIIDEKIASMSCKAAVKGNNKLSFPEAKALIDELLTLDNPYHCPHGRPTIISMSKYEIEKKFKRII